MLRFHPLGWQDENLGSAVFETSIVKGLFVPFVWIRVVSIFHSDAHEFGCTNGVVIADIVAECVDEEVREVDDMMHVLAGWSTP